MIFFMRSITGVIPISIQTLCLKPFTPSVVLMILASIPALAFMGLIVFTIVENIRFRNYT